MQVSHLQTENGFYYSFYKDVVEADSLWAGLDAVLRDTRSEYPMTVNALHRFNVYQEMVLGFTYRALALVGLAGDPFLFFKRTAKLRLIPS